MENKKFEIQRRDLLIQTLKKEQTANESEIEALKTAIKDAVEFNRKLLAKNSRLKNQLLSGCTLLQLACEQLESLKKVQAG